MRKFLSVIMCLLLILISMPGSALAETTAKNAFIDGYLSYVDNSVKMQEAIMQGLQQNTIRFSLDADLREANLTLEDGTKLSNVPGQASINLAFDLSDFQASLDFKIKASDFYTVNGQAFLTKEGLIVPRETIKSLAASGADLGELGDLDKLPPYVVYEAGMNAEELNTMQQAIKEGMNAQTQQTAIAKALIREILNIFPEKCFYYSGSKPVLDLTRVSLAEVVVSLKEHGESLADQFASTIAKPAGMNDVEFEAMKEDMKSSLVQGLNSIGAEDVDKALKEFPISLQKGQIILSPNNVESDFNIKSSALPDGTSFVLAMKSNGKIDGTTESSSGIIDFTLKSSKFNMEMHVNSQGRTTLNEAAFTLIISGKGGDNQNSVKGKINIAGALDWSKKRPIQPPQITYYNSKIVKRPLVKHENTNISLLIDGEIVVFTDSQPLLINGVAFVPLRALGEDLGCSVKWQAPDTVIFSNGSGEDLVMTIDSTSYQIGDGEYFMNQAPFIDNGRVYVPLRLVSEYCGLTIDWDGTGQVISLKH